MKGPSTLDMLEASDFETSKSLIISNYIHGHKYGNK